MPEKRQYLGESLLALVRKVFRPRPVSSPALFGDSGSSYILSTPPDLASPVIIIIIIIMTMIIIFIFIYIYIYIYIFKTLPHISLARALLTFLTCNRNPASAIVSIQHRGKVRLAVLFASSCCCFLPQNTPGNEVHAQIKKQRIVALSTWFARSHHGRRLVSLSVSDSKKREGHSTSLLKAGLHGQKAKGAAHRTSPTEGS